VELEAKCCMMADGHRCHDKIRCDTESRAQNTESVRSKNTAAHVGSFYSHCGVSVYVSMAS
jgi:hypothetical protein